MYTRAAGLPRVIVGEDPVVGDRVVGLEDRRGAVGEVPDIHLAVPPEEHGEGIRSLVAPVIIPCDETLARTS